MQVATYSISLNNTNNATELFEGTVNGNLSSIKIYNLAYNTKYLLYF